MGTFLVCYKALRIHYFLFYYLMFLPILPMLFAYLQVCCMSINSLPFVITVIAIKTKKKNLR